MKVHRLRLPILAAALFAAPLAVHAAAAGMVIAKPAVINHGPVNPGIIVIDDPIFGDGGIIPIDPGIGGGDDPVFADEDEDGLPDAWELDYGLDPTDPDDADLDADEDGLTNAEEYAYGSDPTVADSDEGGASDFEEWVITNAARNVIDAITSLFTGGDDDGSTEPGDEGTGSDDGSDPTTGGTSSTTGGVTNSGSSMVQMRLIDPELLRKLREKLAIDGSTGTGESVDVGDEPVIEDDSGLTITDAAVIRSFCSPQLAGDTAATDDSTLDTDVPEIDDPNVIFQTTGGVDPSTAVDILSSILDGFDPNDDSDDELVSAAVAKLKAAKAWKTAVGIARGDIDVLSLLFGVQNNFGVNHFSGGTIKTGVTKANTPDDTQSGSQGSSGNASGAAAPKAGNYSGGGGSGGASSPSQGSAGNQANAGTPASAGGGTGSGGGHSSSGGSGLPRGAYSGGTTIHVHTTFSSTGAAGVPAPRSHESERDHGSRDHGGSFGGGSSSPAPTTAHSSSASPASSSPSSSGGAGGVALMGFATAAGWLVRRLLAMI